MAHNVELKLRLADPEAARRRIEAVAEHGPELLEQEDVFFHSRRGRLKLRRSGESAELIYYERPDREEPAESQYLKTACSEPAALEAMLSVALGARGAVRKRRHLYHVGSVRLHLDDVENLGWFLEIEAVLEPSEEVAVGRRRVRDLLSRLDLDGAEPLAAAYIDLLEQR